MAILASLLSCCTSSNRPGKLEAQTRHARIIAITNAQPDRWRCPIVQPESYHHDNPPPRYDEIAQYPLTATDEKSIPVAFQVTVEEDEAPPPPASPRSSVVSIPSTRLTDLTTARTGETTHRSGRESLERVWTRSSLPAYSDRSSSPVASLSVAGRDGDRDPVWQHPVMTNDWLEVLQQETQIDSADTTRWLVINVSDDDLERYTIISQSTVQSRAMLLGRTDMHLEALGLRFPDLRSKRKKIYPRHFPGRATDRTTSNYLAP
ncbi:hypothetical protein AYL99_10838 [Fonsecaea erecta]|uniref:Uncharacterized protein n=1 Tax=Fonsecaea erecta TaxID=1367422 RepID=A0A178Z5U0_9EURO|nr:hypothetical protein AYL99_10838 [Fonsecaea erecta]OAP55138.1 hypothetical protein AYL99_10838 [Fonsecaea erecta]